MIASDGICSAIVEKTASDKALVRIRSEESCGQCGRHKSCSDGSQKGRSMWVLDPLGVEPGMKVVVEMSSEGLLAASFILYGLPLAGLLVGAIVGQLANAEPGSAVGAGLGLLFSFPLIRFFGNRVGEKKEFVAKIKKIEDFGRPAGAYNDTVS